MDLEGDLYQIKLLPFGEQISCSEEETVIDAMERAGRPVPFGCRGGHCGACKARVVDGEIETTEDASDFVLPRAEREEGYTLLCCALPVSDTVQVQPLFYLDENSKTGGEILATVRAVRIRTPTVRHLELDLRTPKHLDFVPGQYVEVQVPGTEEWRAYTLANLPGQPVMDLFVRLVPGGLFSRYVDEQVSPGTELRLRGPLGACVLRDSDAPLVLLGRGCGLAPLVSILDTLSAQRSSRRLTLMVGGTDESDLFCTDDCGEEMLRWRSCLPNLEVVTSLSHPSPSWAGLRGRITEHVPTAVTDPVAAEAHVCGPPDMVEDAVRALKQAGVPSEQIAYEPYTYTHHRTSARAGATSPTISPDPVP